MTEQKSQAPQEPNARERFHGRLMSLLLAVIWIMAALMVRQNSPEIPTSMLLFGTVFFIMLVPAMKELVNIIDRRVRSQLGLGEPVDE